MRTQLIDRLQIKVDEDVYPRCNWGWQTAYDYAMSMKTGAVFPPIVVAQYRRKYLLVDGKHRLEAYKQIKQDTIDCIVLTGLSKEQIYLEAIKSNVANGRPLTSQDKAKVIYDLRNMNFSDDKISGIIQIPLGKIENFMSNRLTNTLNGEIVILKAPMKHLAGQTITEEQMNGQNCYSTTGQIAIFEQAVSLLETGSVDLKNPKVLLLLKDLNSLTRKAVLSTRRK